MGWEEPEAKRSSKRGYIASTRTTSVIPVACKERRVQAPISGCTLDPLERPGGEAGRLIGAGLIGSLAPLNPDRSWEIGLCGENWSFAEDKGYHATWLSGIRFQMCGTDRLREKRFSDATETELQHCLCGSSDKLLPPVVRADC